MAQDSNVLDELVTFRKELKSYKRRLASEKQHSQAQKRYTENLREKLVYKAAALREAGTGLSEKRYYRQFGQVNEIWATGLSPSGYLPDKLTALGYCIDATNEAIVKVETMGKLSKYQLTSPIYWMERFGRWIPIDTTISWVKRHRLMSVIVTLIMLIAAILGILEYFF